MSASALGQDPEPVCDGGLLCGSGCWRATFLPAIMQESKRDTSGQRSVRPLLTLGLVGVSALVVWWLAMSPPTVHQVSPFGAAGEEATIVPADPSKPAAKASPLTAEQKAAAPPSRTDELQKSVAAPDVEEQARSGSSPALPVRQGPVDELAQRFAGESRAASSDQEDARVRAAFSDPAIPPEMLHSVECRRSVCRAELRWSAQHDSAYVLGLTRAVGTFSAPVGIEGVGAPDSQGLRPLVVYFGLQR